jgi:hypothetical protein
MIKVSSMKKAWRIKHVCNVKPATRVHLPLIFMEYYVARFARYATKAPPPPNNLIIVKQLHCALRTTLHQ